MIGTPARFAVVEILNRLHSADERREDTPPFGDKERKMLEQEIIHQVIIGMGRLDVSEENFPSPISKEELTPVFSSTVLPSSSTDKNMLPSEAQSPPSLQLEAPDSTTEALATQVIPLSLTSTFSNNSPPQPTSPPLQEITSQPSFASPSPPHKEDCNGIRPCIQPGSEATIGETASKPFNSEDEGWLIAARQECQDTQDEANEQAAIGRLSSMSLIATVTAYGRSG